MAKNKKINKLVIFFTIAIVEMILVAGFFGYKTYLIIDNMKALNRETVVLKQKTAEASVAVDLKKENEKTLAEAKELKDRFFDDTSLLYFLKDFSVVANKYNISINNISFGKLKEVADTTPPIKGLPVNMSMSGSYDNLIKFLSYLEKYKHFVVPGSLSVSNVSQIKSQLVRKTNNISVSFVLYVQTPSEGVWSYGGK